MSALHHRAAVQNPTRWPAFAGHDTGEAGFSIGGVAIGGRVLLAPMTGVSDLPFRRAASRQGAPYVATEMVPATPSRAAGPTSCAAPPWATA